MADTLARQRQIIGTSADWAAHDLTLGAGELALERRADGTMRARVGDGTTPFSASPYLAGSTSDAIRYRGNADPTAAPPAGAVPGDAYSASPGGVVAASWGAPAAGQTVVDGALLVQDDDGAWHVSGAIIDTGDFVEAGELAGTGPGQGAAMVGFDPGATGAPATNLQIHVKRGDLYLDDFTGVDPTGVSDSTAGIQAAINAALLQGKALIGGTGIYRHTGQLLVKSRNFNPRGLYAQNAFTPGLVFIGRGPQNTIFRSAVPSAYAWDFGVDVDVLFTFSATTALGSPVLTGVSSAVTPAVEIGALITGSGIPANATVLSKTATTITLSANAIAPAPGTVTLTHSIYKAMRNTAIHGAGFDADTAVAGTSGWFVRSQVHFLADSCIFTGFASDGVRVYSEDGDLDGPSYIDFHSCDWFNCQRWALDATGLPARNEINFLRLTQCWMQDNGTTQAFVPTMSAGAEPTSGAMRWKGQSASFRDGGFTVNKNVSLLILGGSGSAATFVCDNVAFENCIDRAFLNTGCMDAAIKNSHLYSNTTYQTKIGFETFGLNNKAATTYENVRIRVAPGVACDAFKNTSIGTTATVKGADFVKRPIIQEFFAANQNMIVGDWEFPVIEQQCELTLSGMVVTFGPSLRGNVTPICQRYGGNGNFGETGWWEPYAVRPTGHAFTINGATAPPGFNYCYFYDNGNVVAFEVSNVAPSATPRLGQLVSSTQGGKLYVGRVFLTGSAGATVLTTGAAARFCNPRWNVALGGWHWLDSGNIQRFKATLPNTETDGTAI